jgi:hypothetical protein
VYQCALERGQFPQRQGANREEQFMKRLLTLLALAGLSAGAAACGDDSGDEGTPTPDTSKDAGKADSAIVSRGPQINEDSLGDSCKSMSDCKGAGELQCLTELGMQELPGGYCTAQCNTDAECGNNGACPAASLASNPVVSQFAGLLSGLIPQQCILKCTPAAAGGSGCSNPEHVCRSFIEGLGSQAAVIGNLIPVAKQTFCFPPIMLPTGDGGVGDAGATAPIVGLDSGL